MWFPGRRTASTESGHTRAGRGSRNQNDFETQSLDILTGKTMILGDDMAWGEDGKTVEEDSGSESELLDEEFETFLDD
ncbi:hypothetical protein VCV18_009306 [Metarhizium anisopliae]